MWTGVRTCEGANVPVYTWACECVRACVRTRVFTLVCACEIALGRVCVCVSVCVCVCLCE